MSKDAILSFNSVHKNLLGFYSKWREVSLPCHKPMGCNHPYFFGCALHIFNHVLLLTDDYSLQRLFRFPPFNSNTCSVFEHAHIRSVNTHSGKCKRTCLKMATGTQRTCCWEINCHAAVARENPSGASGLLLTASKGLRPPVIPLRYQRHRKCIQSATLAPPYDNAEVIIKVVGPVPLGRHSIPTSQSPELN